MDRTSLLVLLSAAPLCVGCGSGKSPSPPEQGSPVRGVEPLLPAETLEIEEQAWRDLHAAFEKGLDEYREFYVTVSLPVIVEVFYPDPPATLETKALRDAFTRQLADDLRADAVYGRRDKADIEEARTSAGWRRTHKYRLGRLPPRGGAQLVASLTLIAERHGHSTSLRAEAELIERNWGADPRWDDALSRIFEGTDVEFRVVSWD